MTYEEKLVQLSEGTARGALQLLAAWQDGRLDRATFLDLVRGIIATGNAQARALAELALRAYLEQALAAPEPVTVAPPVVDDRPRLHKALETVLASNLDTAMQVERLARNEPLEAATGAFSDGMKRNKRRVSGWTRGLEADACELCRWWWREGRVWRPDHPMPRHVGCTCHPVPTVTTTANYQTQQQHEGAMATRAQRERNTA